MRLDEFIERLTQCGVENEPVDFSYKTDGEEEHHVRYRLFRRWTGDHRSQYLVPFQEISAETNIPDDVIARVCSTLLISQADWESGTDSFKR